MRTALALICFAAPAAAQETFVLPAGCDAFLTVQSESCQVDHHFTCQGDPDGHQRRVSLDEEGVTYAGVIDRETQWISSFHVRSGHREQLESDPAEPASISDLIETGLDDYDFRTFSDEIGTTRYVGQDTLTGREITIDGVTLAETTYDITALDEAGNEVWSSKGNEFISRNWRMFIAGTGVVTTSNGEFEQSNRPVEFIYPGEPGFLSSSPKHGCGVAIS
ncbi:hypothetical protein [Roseobacter sp. CCS2]|uniref:hypothetical protein n=1 Tax=Roseobacter sp. CCS2 TaxID=391593 RepID=UPI0000F3F112|nr:hypothetical protein [Roseobacter sp. CCS2]EBA11198.1 hypothetical protein RCCS2_10515 [Roseobacter sp. CCS2]